MIDMIIVEAAISVMNWSGIAEGGDSVRKVFFNSDVK